MKKLYVLAALLMATTAAHAGNSISFEVEGHKIRIEVPKNCDSLSCIQISAPSLSGSGFGFKGITSKRLGDDNDVAVNSDAPAPKSAPAPVDQQAAPQPSVPPANSAAPASTVVASTATAPAIGRDAPISSIYGRACHVAARPVAAAPVEAPATPLGIWTTEDNKGNVRVEQCGQNLCGYAADSGEKILINMKPSNAKWTGRIHDPDSGRSYDSTIAMKGPNSLRVQGCAFSGMFCGGQTWKRVS